MARRTGGNHIRPSQIYNTGCTSANNDLRKIIGSRTNIATEINGAVDIAYCQFSGNGSIRENGTADIDQAIGTGTELGILIDRNRSYKIKARVGGIEGQLGIVGDNTCGYCNRTRACTRLLFNLAEAGNIAQQTQGITIGKIHCAKSSGNTINGDITRSTRSS